MANYARKVAENIDGLFFVDDTCIDCDTCRELAPETFADVGSYSSVYRQPVTSEETLRASRALISCPTGSIGTTEKIDLIPAFDSLPLELEENIYYNGYASPDSFGASSYFIRHPEGNWLVDSPKYQVKLVKKFEEWGGIKYIFLSHQDDVADAHRYAKHFSATRIIHRADQRAEPDAEMLIDGEDPVAITSDHLIIPVPGHTRGSCVLLYKDILFTGDHLWWSRNRKTLGAGRSVCWYDWGEQTRSMKKLLAYDFRRVLPGHGERVELAADEMKAHLEKLVSWMQARG
ncbi:MAG TPA: MBL fold metallo-hydrolase [Candidatus Kapabacteria bacterium]|nr:MBL fold metallo-hydrolase [Candidatus Kapabacteria bacterium]